jgi:hypothetical protein
MLRLAFVDKTYSAQIASIVPRMIFFVIASRDRGI